MAGVLDTRMMRSVRPLYIPPLEIDHSNSGSLIMRDGSTAVIRRAEPSDAAVMQQFVDRLSPASRRHKTEVGGVQLNLIDEQAVRQAVDSIRTRLTETDQLDTMEGVLVQPMVTGGVEAMIGVTDDPCSVL